MKGKVVLERAVGHARAAMKVAGATPTAALLERSFRVKLS
jgi:hypothetical protein